VLPRNIALLLIAVQKGWDEPYWGRRSHPEAEARMAELARAFRTAGLEVVHIAADSRDPSSPLFPSEPGHRFKAEAEPAPGEAVFHTHGQSAFTGTGLEDHLRERGIERLVLAGFTVSHAVSSTARAACDLGFRTVVLRDATVAFERDDVDGNRMAAQALHEAGLAELHGEVAMVLPAQAILDLL
jgi:nicotinamidase-related amidase